MNRLANALQSTVCILAFGLFHRYWIDFPIILFRLSQILRCEVECTSDIPMYCRACVHCQRSARTPYQVLHNASKLPPESVPPLKSWGKDTVVPGRRTHINELLVHRRFVVWRLTTNDPFWNKSYVFVIAIKRGCIMVVVRLLSGDRCAFVPHLRFWALAVFGMTPEVCWNCYDRNLSRNRYLLFVWMQHC